MEPNHELPADDEGSCQNHAQPEANQENGQNTAVPDPMILRALARVTDNLHVAGHDLGPGMYGFEVVVSRTANQLTMLEDLYGRGPQNDNDDPEIARRRILLIRVPLAWFDYLTEQQETGNEHLAYEQEVRDAIAYVITQFCEDREYFLAVFRVARLLVDLPRITPAEIQQFNRDAGANGPEIASYCVVCSSDWDDEDKIDAEIVVLPCHPTHVLHSDCAHESFITHPRCPLCREKLRFPDLYSFYRPATSSVNNL